MFLGGTVRRGLPGYLIPTSPPRDPYLFPWGTYTPSMGPILPIRALQALHPGQKHQNHPLRGKKEQPAVKFGRFLSFFAVFYGFRPVSPRFFEHSANIFLFFMIFWTEKALSFIGAGGGGGRGAQRTLERCHFKRCLIYIWGGNYYNNPPSASKKMVHAPELDQGVRE